MRKRLIAVGCTVAVVAGLTAGSAVASTPERAEDPFACPVLHVNEQAAENAGRFNEIGEGEYTFGPGAAGNSETFNGKVPNHATNADGSGAPGGEHSGPGDTNYTAIWSGNS